MSTTDEWFRAVNMYYNVALDEYYYQYSKVYRGTGPARAMATSKRVKKIQAMSKVSGAYEYYDYEDTWCEVATEWEKV